MKIKHLLAILLLFTVIPTAWAMEEVKPKDGATEEVTKQVDEEGSVSDNENPEKEPGEEEKEATEEEYEADSESGESDEEKEAEPEPEAPAGPQGTTATDPQPQAAPPITHNDIAQYLWFHIRHFFSIEQNNGQFRNITSQELIRLWNDLKSQTGNVGKVFTGEADKGSSFLDRLGEGIKTSWQSRKVRATAGGTAVVGLLDFLLTNLTTWEQQAHKDLVARYRNRSLSFEPDENSRVMALFFYSFLAMMGSRLNDHDADINRKNLIEILVKVAIGTAAGSMAWNSLRRYVFGKGSTFSTNVKKSLKFALLCTVALASGNLMAGGPGGSQN